MILNNSITRHAYFKASCRKICSLNLARSTGQSHIWQFNYDCILFLTPSVNYFSCHGHGMCFSHGRCCPIGSAIVFITEKAYYWGISTRKRFHSLMVFCFIRDVWQNRDCIGRGADPIRNKLTPLRNTVGPRFFCSNFTFILWLYFPTEDSNSQLMVPLILARRTFIIGITTFLSITNLFSANVSLITSWVFSR